uniref:PHD-type domain-containing protein n=1 Tax=Macrostomum lignano TaxID=282301 RepID=A0A1I8FJB1_9PLAT
MATVLASCSIGRMKPAPMPNLSAPTGVRIVRASISCWPTGLPPWRLADQLLSPGDDSSKEVRTIGPWLRLVSLARNWQSSLATALTGGQIYDLLAYLYCGRRAAAPKAAHCEPWRCNPTAPVTLSTSPSSRAPLSDRPDVSSSNSSWACHSASAVGPVRLLHGHADGRHYGGWREGTTACLSLPYPFSLLFAIWPTCTPRCPPGAQPEPGLAPDLLDARRDYLQLPGLRLACEAELAQRLTCAASPASLSWPTVAMRDRLLADLRPIRGQQSAAMLESAGTLPGRTAGRSAWPAWPGSCAGRLAQPAGGSNRSTAAAVSSSCLPLAGPDNIVGRAAAAIPPAPSIACCLESVWREAAVRKIRLQRRQRRQHRQSGVEVGGKQQQRLGVAGEMSRAEPAAAVASESVKEVEAGGRAPAGNAPASAVGSYAAKLLSATSRHRRRQSRNRAVRLPTFKRPVAADNASPQSQSQVPVPVHSPVISSSNPALATLTCRNCQRGNQRPDRVITDRPSLSEIMAEQTQSNFRFELEPRAVGSARMPAFKRQSQRQRKSLSMSSAAPPTAEDEQRQRTASTPPRKPGSRCRHTDATTAFSADAPTDFRR